MRDAHNLEDWGNFGEQSLVEENKYIHRLIHEDVSSVVSEEVGIR